MSDFALDFGQRFVVGDVEFEVVSIASNENLGENTFEVMTVEDADKRQVRNQPEDLTPVEEPTPSITPLVEREFAAVPEPQAPVAPAPTTMHVK